MSRGKHGFKLSELRRSVRGVRQEGLQVRRVLVNPKTGQFELDIGTPEPQGSQVDEWQDWHPHDKSAA
jgi:hypothetical protein